MTTMDWISLGLAILGAALIVIQLYLHDWDIEKVMFK